MRALIYCAGLGTRLRPLTNKIPKAMVKVGGVPCLEWIVNDLQSQGISEIIVNLHYKSEKIMQYFGTELLYMYEPDLLGEERTLKTLITNFPSFTDEYLLIRNGDTITNLDLVKMLGMSKGESVAHYDTKDGEEVWAGTKILSPDYFKGKKNIARYYSKNVWWHDIGTPKGLENANKQMSIKLT